VAGVRTATWSLTAAAVIGGLVPTPVGKGPRYRPAAQETSTGSCRRGALHTGDRVHLELFALGRVVIVPVGIGIGGPRLRLGRVVAARCRRRLWTLDPSGVVRFERQATLGEFFDVWGQPLGPRRLASFHGAVSVYVNGSRRRGDPRGLRLRDGDEIVLEVGRHVPPHRSYRFPP